VPDSLPPAEVQRLIDEVLASMDHVDVLLQLHATPNENASVDELASRTRLDRASIARVFDDFEAAGILRSAEDGYRYTPKSKDLSAVDALEEMYRTRPVTLIRALYARPGRIRTYSSIFPPRSSD